jgi:hypothetical protein
MISTTPFVLGLVAVVVLAQVPLVWYLSRYVALDPDADRPDPREGFVTYGTRDARPPTNEPPSVDAAGRVACAQCGAAVDATYEFCGACAGRVRARASPQGAPGASRGGPREGSR